MEVDMYKVRTICGKFDSDVPKTFFRRDEAVNEALLELSISRFTEMDAVSKTLLHVYLPGTGVITNEIWDEECGVFVLDFCPFVPQHDMHVLAW
jgi:hypothetical protein